MPLRCLCSLKETVAKPIVDDVLMAVQQDDGKTPVRGGSSAAWGGSSAAWEQRSLEQLQLCRQWLAILAVLVVLQCLLLPACRQLTLWRGSP